MDEKLPAPCEPCRGSGLRKGVPCSECAGKGYRLMINGRPALALQESPRWQPQHPAYRQSRQQVPHQLFGLARSRLPRTI